VELWQLIAIVTGLLIVMIGGIFVVFALHKKKMVTPKDTEKQTKKAEEDIEHIFDDAFRERFTQSKKLAKQSSNNARF